MGVLGGSDLKISFLKIECGLDFQIIKIDLFIENKEIICNSEGSIREKG